MHRMLLYLMEVVQTDGSWMQGSRASVMLWAMLCCILSLMWTHITNLHTVRGDSVTTVFPYGSSLFQHPVILQHYSEMV